ncbi:hypothetical protein Ahy_A02g007866 [Arachis hypogaea]|uniref:Zinc finger PMZ-type domain-containing protein n=1 Tax=Arachis hypogaea TaxID=3818 RepID=A0A445EDY0_ARAHY|nr:hypothetical protein Ahy_A02g007866 [Arachis hypogaea]
MTSDWSFTQAGSEEDPSNEFEVGQQFKNKEEVMLQEKWEVRRYTDPQTCIQTSMGQDYRRLDSKVIAQHIFTMVKADPTISIRVLQGGVENHFGYKTSYKKGFEALAQLQVDAEFSWMLMKAIEFNSKHVNTMNVYQFDRSRTNFTALHLPCCHIIAACSHGRLDWKRFVHPVYRMELVFNVYRSEFRPIGHKDDWPSYDGPRIHPNPRMMRVKRGRPISSRICNNVDYIEHNEEKRCGLCCQSSHTWRTCTALDGGGASSSRR